MIGSGQVHFGRVVAGLAPCGCLALAKAARLDRQPGRPASAVHDDLRSVPIGPTSALTTTQRMDRRQAWLNARWDAGAPARLAGRRLARRGPLVVPVKSGRCWRFLGRELPQIFILQFVLQ